MDMTDDINEYLESKNLSAGTTRTQRSILLSFNKWAAVKSFRALSSAASAYGDYLKKRDGLKPKTIEKHIGVINGFCDWMMSSRDYSGFKLDEHFMGNPSFIEVPEPPVDKNDMQRMCKIAIDEGPYGVKCATMALFVLTCGLRASEIASLTGLDVATDLSQPMYVRRCGFCIPLSKIAADMYWCYRIDAKVPVIWPLFPTSSNPSIPMRTSEVKRCINWILARIGHTYNEVSNDDSQLTIAQHFKHLSNDAKQAVAAYVQSMHYLTTPMPQTVYNTVMDARRQKNAEEFAMTHRKVINDLQQG